MSTLVKDERVFSASRKFWFDKISLGEIAMSVEKIEFKTSFPIEKESSFVLIDGNACFKDDSIFILWNHVKILIYYLNENVAMHLSQDDCDEDFVSVDVLGVKNQEEIEIEIKFTNNNTKKMNLKMAMKYFKPGRGYI